jgi:phosphoglycerate dehydrogenase-like enzyme
MARILFCGSTFPDAPQFLRQRLPVDARDEIIVWSKGDIRSSLDGVDVLIPKMQRIDRDLMQSTTLRLIQQWGAGLEGIDLDAARARNIWVSNVPASGGNAESVAEHTLLLILSLLRILPIAQSNVRSGILGAPLGNMLSGRTVCLYGLGAIALALAKRLGALGVRLLGVTRDPSASKIAEFGLNRCFCVAERDQCFEQTDILVLCVRYSEDLRDTIGPRELARLPRGAYLINVARGGLVNYKALYSALQTGGIAGAALDVFWEEPIAVDDPILKLPNVIATPHVGGITSCSFGEIADAVAANIERLRCGQPPLNRVA